MSGQTDNKQALEAQIAADKEELRQLQEREAALLRTIPLKGFKAATDRVRIVEKMQVLSDSIRRAEEHLHNS